MQLHPIAFRLDINQAAPPLFSCLAAFRLDISQAVPPLFYNPVASCYFLTRYKPSGSAAVQLSCCF